MLLYLVLYYILIFLFRSVNVPEVSTKMKISRIESSRKPLNAPEYSLTEIYKMVEKFP